MFRSFWNETFPTWQQDPHQDVGHSQDTEVLPELPGKKKDENWGQAEGGGDQGEVAEKGRGGRVRSPALAPARDRPGEEAERDPDGGGEAGRRERQRCVRGEAVRGLQVTLTHKLALSAHCCRRNDELIYLRIERFISWFIYELKTLIDD